MKTCPKCGIALTDEVAFCTACGTAVPAPRPEVPAQPEAPVQPAYVPPVYVPPVAPVSYAPPVEEKEKVISVGGWIGRDLIACIPFVGGIIYFIMLWVWAFKKSNEASFRNWAKSRLVWMAIGFGIGLVVIILMAVAGIGMADVLSEMNY